jgi:hypothetical protein
MRPATQGTYYRRIWRNGGDSPPLNEGADQASFNRCGRSVLALCSELENIFQFIEPGVNHNTVYGPALQRLLFLACSEAETAWAGILNANGYPNTTRWTTNDYVKIEPAMGLRDYSVSLVDVAGYPWIYPFRGWTAANPTVSLAWYDAYNKVKHDNERNAQFATLKNVIEACAAVYVLAIAQFGQHPFLPDGRFGQRVIYIETVHNYQKTDVYHGISGGGSWVAVNYPFK